MAAELDLGIVQSKKWWEVSDTGIFVLPGCCVCWLKSTNISEIIFHVFDWSWFHPFHTKTKQSWNGITKLQKEEKPKTVPSACKAKGTLFWMLKDAYSVCHEWKWSVLHVTSGTPEALSFTVWQPTREGKDHHATWQCMAWHCLSVCACVHACRLNFNVYRIQAKLVQVIWTL